MVCKCTLSFKRRWTYRVHAKAFSSSVWLRKSLEIATWPRPLPCPGQTCRPHSNSFVGPRKPGRWHGCHSSGHSGSTPQIDGHLSHSLLSVCHREPFLPPAHWTSPPHAAHTRAPHINYTLYIHYNYCMYINLCVSAGNGHGVLCYKVHYPLQQLCSRHTHSRASLRAHLQDTYMYYPPTHMAT